MTMKPTDAPDLADESVALESRAKAAAVTLRLGISEGTAASLYGADAVSEAKVRGYVTAAT